MTRALTAAEVALLHAAMEPFQADVARLIERHVGEVGVLTIYAALLELTGELAARVVLDDPSRRPGILEQLDALRLLLTEVETRQ